jgi:hypothetical protein
MSHNFPLSDVCVAQFKTWETPLGKVEQSARCSEISKIDEKTDKPIFSDDCDVHLDEHCLEVQLPFLQKVLDPNFKIIPMLIGEVSPRTVAKTLDGLIHEDDLIVVSSDFSHYFEYEKAKELDKKTIDAILALNTDLIDTIDCEACGYKAIAVLIEIAKLRGWKPVLIEYINSGDVTGDKGRVVGYAGVAFVG